jgi:hypothetical protein
MTHRRDFVASCGALVLALSGCQSVLSRTRLAKLELDDPHPDDYEPVLRALIKTILPFDHPRFPRIAAAEVQERLLALFPLGDARYLVLQKGLMVFDRVDLFPLLQTPMAAEERTLRDATDTAIAERAAQDQRRYVAWRRAFPSEAESFIALQPQARTEYFRLWGQSEFNSKALFYHSAKRLVMVTAYSMSDFWRVIGYAGPLLKPS